MDPSKNLCQPLWNNDAGGLVFCWPQNIGTTAPTETVLNRLEVAVELDDRHLSFPAWTLEGEKSAVSETDGIALRIEWTPEHSIVAHVINKSKVVRKLGRFVFRAAKTTRNNDLLSLAGSRLRLFREGWTMASPAASVRLGETDFKLNPEYKPFATSAPGEYFDSEANRFSAEYLALLHDHVSGVSVLAGFVSSRNQMARIAVVLDNEGIASFEAIAHCDDMEMEPGDEVSSEELLIMAGTDGYGLLEKFATIWGKRMNALTWGHLPTGWCSWYYYFEKVSEKDMLENIAWLKERKNDFPIEYIQMDDGFQSALGDWLICNRDKFPNGLEFLAREIQAAGFKAGLWVAPFMVEERSELFRIHSDWMVKNRSGETVWVADWRGSRVAVLDCTNPAATDWLTETFSALTDMGFEYVKIDFVMYECSATALGGIYHDRKATRAQALRRGFQAIRKGMGEKFILGCTSPLGPEIGLVNGARIGTDITPYWQTDDAVFYKEAPSVPNVCRNVINRSYMNGRLWINDPDTHIARMDNSRLTEDEVFLWTSALWLAGGMLFLSDRFKMLTPERAGLSKMLLNDLGRFQGARPLDFLDREYPAVWLAKSEKKPEELAVGVFNFEDHARNVMVSLNVSEDTRNRRFAAKDFWSGQSLSDVSGPFEVELRPHACKVFILNPHDPA